MFNILLYRNCINNKEKCSRNILQIMQVNLIHNVLQNKFHFYLVKCINEYRFRFALAILKILNYFNITIQAIDTIFIYRCGTKLNISVFYLSYYKNEIILVIKWVFHIFIKREYLWSLYWNYLRIRQFLYYGGIMCRVWYRIDHRKISNT